MRFNYHADTDSLYINVSERTSADSLEIVDGVVLDFDSDGVMTGIEMEDVESAAKPAKFEEALRNAAEEDLTADEQRILSQAFDQVLAGRHLRPDAVAKAQTE